MDTAESLSSLLRSHRSIRRFKPDPIDPAVVEAVCAEAIAGTSSSGNLNSYSLVLTEDRARRERLYELHFRQDMIRQAPLVISFCADTFRTRRWLRLRQARDNFGNFLGFVVAAFDAMILAQSVALGFESRGLGICYLGTTLNACAEIADFLQLPETCIPVTTLAIRWPDEAPAKRDRLPLASYLHRETYRHLDDAELLDLYAEREVRGWARYNSAGPEMARLFEAHGVTSLAQFYTSELKYPPARFRAVSRRLFETLRAKGFADRRGAGGHDAKDLA
jgi:nitroreductase